MTSFTAIFVFFKLIYTQSQRLYSAVCIHFLMRLISASQLVPAFFVLVRSLSFNLVPAYFCHYLCHILYFANSAFSDNKMKHCQTRRFNSNHSAVSSEKRRVVVFFFFVLYFFPLAITSFVVAAA